MVCWIEGGELPCGCRAVELMVVSSKNFEFSAGKAYSGSGITKKRASTEVNLATHDNCLEENMDKNGCDKTVEYIIIITEV